MSREIKYRAWFKNDGGFMMEDVGILPQSTPYEVSVIQETQKQIIKYGLDNIILMQYTGLKDKNGKEIYEGDICKISSCDDEGNWQKETTKTEIKYYDGCFKTTYYGFPVSSWAIGNNVHIEIIGNIHQHPHLLEKTND